MNGSNDAIGLRGDWHHSYMNATPPTPDAATATVALAALTAHGERVAEQMRRELDLLQRLTTGR
jgi:hypothetical protein